MNKIKKLAIAGAASAIMLGSLASTAFAFVPVVSTAANPDACFGQARGAYAQYGPNGVLSPLSNGSYISDRAGTNPANNAAYRATYCTE